MNEIEVTVMLIVAAAVVGPLALYYACFQYWKHCGKKMFHMYLNAVHSKWLKTTSEQQRSEYTTYIKHKHTIRTKDNNERI